MKINGFLGLKRKQDVRKYSPDVGWEHTVKFEGAGPSAMRSCYAVGRQFADDGYLFTVEPAGDNPGWILTCVGANPGDGSVEEPVERWSWRKELIQKSIWTHPDVVTEQAAWNAWMDINDPSNDLLSKGYKADIEDAVENSLKLDQVLFPSNQFPVANWVFLELKRGADSYEVTTPVLSVQRTTQPTSQNKIQVGVLETVYSSAALITALNGIGLEIPQFIQAIMPGMGTNGNHADLPSAKWGWRERDNQGSIENGVRHMQQIEWVYAAWSTNFYGYVGS